MYTSVVAGLALNLWFDAIQAGPLLVPLSYFDCCIFRMTAPTEGAFLMSFRARRMLKQWHNRSCYTRM